jgi:hypothetical protein
MNNDEASTARKLFSSLKTILQGGRNNNRANCANQVKNFSKPETV